VSAGAQEATRGALLEREHELGRLRALAAAAAAGRGGAVVIEGAAGIGKTTLVREAVRAAAGAGLEVLAARGGELERDVAYGLVRALLERPVAAAAPPRRAALLDGAAALAAPAVGLPAAVAADAPGILRDDPTGAALHGLYWLTANLAAETPLLVAVDDLHWADGASLRFLAYLARRVDELPVALVLATRPPAESHARDLLEALLAEPLAERLRPPALSAAAVAAVVLDRLGGRAGPGVAEACAEATGGNPFLLDALLTALAGRGAVAAGDVGEAGAEAARAGTARRLAALGPDARELARAVAVLGTEADPRRACRIAGLEPDAALRAEDALMEAGVLARRRPLDFVHPLVRAAVAGELSPPERARRHLGAARLLDAEGDDAERVAAHLLAADARDDPWAVRVLRRAAARSLRRGAPEAAVRYLRRALDEPPAADERPAVLAELGRAEVRAALPDEAAAHLRAALAATTAPAEQAQLAHDLAVALIAPGRYEEAVEVLQEAVALARRADADLARGLEAELICAARLDRRTVALSVTAAAEAARDAPEGTPGGRMLRATLAHEQVLRGGTAAQTAEHARSALDGGLIEQLTADSGLVLDAGFALIIAGDFPAAEAVWDAALEDVRRRGSVIGFARGSCMRSLLRLRQGRLRDAESEARTAIAAASDAGYQIGRMAHGPLVEALVAQGQLGEAAEALRTAGLDGEIPDTLMLNFVLFARARLRLARGDRAAGAAELQELARREQRWRAQAPAVFPYRSLLAGSGAVAPGDARALAREELELARRWGAPGPVGRALRVLGLVESGDAGRTLLEESLAVLDGSAWRLEQAETLVELGAALRRARARRDAREPLHAGMELAHLCGAAPLVARAREELLATGARPRRVMRTGVDALTATERRVAAMAAEGMTNRQIAQALFVTLRTVESHLGRVYQKLGVASRDELPPELAAS